MKTTVDGLPAHTSGAQQCMGEFRSLPLVSADKDYFVGYNLFPPTWIKFSIVTPRSLLNNKRALLY